ncbi:hypothetical protein SK128_024695 [Halocaridina rubra]|uniref:Uncharacterized protein n=1 Tax=Halocaridina rubra TaxID=373956 RepID=A0AAN8XKZ8_HALRR
MMHYGFQVRHWLVTIWIIFSCRILHSLANQHCTKAVIENDRMTSNFSSRITIQASATNYTLPNFFIDFNQNGSKVYYMWVLGTEKRLTITKTEEKYSKYFNLSNANPQSVYLTFHKNSEVWTLNIKLDDHKNTNVPIENINFDDIDMIEVGTEDNTKLVITICYSASETKSSTIIPRPKTTACPNYPEVVPYSPATTCPACPEVTPSSSATCPVCQHSTPSSECGNTTEASQYAQHQQLSSSELKGCLERVTLFGNTSSVQTRFDPDMTISLSNIKTKTYPFEIELQQGNKIKYKLAGKRKEHYLQITFTDDIITTNKSFPLHNLTDLGEIVKYSFKKISQGWKFEIESLHATKRSVSLTNASLDAITTVKVNNKKEKDLEILFSYPGE